MLTPDQLREIAERDFQWRNPRRGVVNPVAPVGRASNAGQAANDRHHLLSHALSTVWRPGERWAAQRAIRDARLGLARMALQWWLSVAPEQKRRFDEANTFRAEGNCLCPVCHRPYAKHTDAPEYRSGIDGEPYLQRLCTGELVKL